MYFETDISCAYCGTKGWKNLTVHHIENPLDNAYDNQIVLCYLCHGKYNNGEINKAEIVAMKRILIYKTLTQQGLSAIKNAARKKEGVPGMDFALNHLIEMRYLTKGGYLFRGGPGDKTDILSLYKITENGRDLYNKWLRQTRFKPVREKSNEQ